MGKSSLDIFQKENIQNGYNSYDSMFNLVNHQEDKQTPQWDAMPEAADEGTAFPRAGGS